MQLNIRCVKSESNHKKTAFLIMENGSLINETV